ncbi:Predicted arabinose efflux permease, MFS family [Roseomonas rosea]|uniref:Predicted arabinose efflux permease, MFS family n=1 Tax=Muricoccus roseus TaxID=198092 RepID=A0A1M6IKN9_9PROT|nr:MFS transporter [Roseomonas rosea]SHJ34937.1 Predicted arabinose efflux permease, MFS family [Roseomonas rosea]
MAEQPARAAPGDSAKAVTRWAEVAVLVGAGVTASLQLGKVAPALLAIAADLQVGLSGAAGLLSVFALMGAVFGLAAGLVAARLGMRRALLAGLWALGAAGLAAAFAPGPALLYACRVVEGAGFLAVVVSAPTLVAARAAPADRALAMSWWSIFMPSGIALGMLAAPVVEGFGWRMAWAVMSLLPPFAALLAGALLPRSAGQPVGAQDGLRRRLAALWRARLPVLLAGAFSCYAVIYFGIAGFLPARLVEGFALALPLAGLAGAAAAIVNIGGNLLAGRLIRRGWRASLLVLSAGMAMALLSAGTFALPFSLGLTLAAALLASGIGGMIPASLFTLVPRSVPEPSLTGPALGLVVQCNNIGSLLAPMAVAAAARQGWGFAALPLLAAGLALVLLARPLRRLG